MRIEVELSEEEAASLFRLAEERGHAKASDIAHEAIAAFLAEADDAEGERRAALFMNAVRGFPREAADRIAEHKEDLRARWRADAAIAALRTFPGEAGDEMAARKDEMRARWRRPSDRAIDLGSAHRDPEFKPTI